MPDAGAQSMLGGWALRANGVFDCGGNTGVGTTVCEKITGSPTADVREDAMCYGFTVGNNITWLHHDNWHGSYIQGYYNIGFIFVQTLAMAWLLHLICSNERRARNGDYEASKRLIMPIYKQIVYVMCACQLVSSIFVVVRLYAKQFEAGDGGCEHCAWAYIKSIMIGLNWGMLHWVAEGVAVFLCQPSAGRAAFWRAVKVGSVSFFVSFVMGTAKHYHTEFNKPEGACNEVWSCAVLPFLYQIWLAACYGYVHFLPGERDDAYTRDSRNTSDMAAQRGGVRIYRRPAAKPYVKFWFYFRVWTIVASIMLASPDDWWHVIDLGLCLDFGMEVFVFTIGKTYAVYTALHDDSMYWQGAFLPDDAGGFGQSSARSLLKSFLGKSSSGDPKPAGEGGEGLLLGEGRLSLSSPLQGKIDIEASDAESISAELQLVDTDLIINFGFLRLDKTKTGMLGSGGSARVYKAELKGEKVAAKVLYCPSIERTTVANFFKEASRLRQVAHPNIVGLRGVCVLPPTICLVLELCSGDLRDHVVDLRTRWFPRLTEGDAKVQQLFGAGADIPAGEDEAQRRVESILSLLRDTSAGVARIHEFGLIHLDIKSQNFLVSKAPSSVSDFTLEREGKVTVKLADLENSVIKEDFGAGKGDDMDVVPDTLDWTAPELMVENGNEFVTQASDVYALAVTWWEVVTLFAHRCPTRALHPPTAMDDEEGGEGPGPGQGAAESLDGLREKLREGWRPQFRGTGFPAQLKQTCRNGWGTRPEDRPSADVMRMSVAAYTQAVTVGAHAQAQ